jgi:hypothetical protein
MIVDAHALLIEAESLTAALLDALDHGTAGTQEILDTLTHRERLLRQLADNGLAPSPREREAVTRLDALDLRLTQAIDVLQRGVASQLAKARTRNAAPTSSARLVQESA